MSELLQTRLFDQLEAIPLIDPHSHINPLLPASRTLADVMGYHYYTELAHSAGLPRETIEAPGLAPKEKVGRLIEKLGALDNTVQYSWLLEMCREFFGFQDDRITAQNWEGLFDTASVAMNAADWEETVLRKTRLEQVFLTNDFDDPLEGFDTGRYVPCLRTDDLVFGLQRASVRERLAKASGVDVRNAATLVTAIGKLFEHFTRRGARACAISLPPDFVPGRETPETTDHYLSRLLAGQPMEPAEFARVSRFVFWALAEHCAEFRLPFDLMIGVNRKVYPGGVYQGQDLFDRRTSLHQYRELFNAFPQIQFPISVLADDSNHELVSYAWIFPNVIPFGHWWYSNTPSVIERHCRNRLEAVPRTKQIGYYSDMYKLEFALPKFRMYRRILAGVLAQDFVLGRGWSEERAVELGRLTLRGNVEAVFFPQRNT